jgi:hypothetical protein
MAKRGAVPRGEFTNKSGVLSTRIREDTRAALQEAAAATKRSLSQEIEHRLRRSFDSDRLIRAEFGSRENYAIVMLIIAALKGAADDKSEAPWFDDANNFDLMLNTVVRILGAFRPPGAAAEASETDRWFGDMNAARIAEDVVEADATMPPQARNDFNYIKADLGPLAERLKSLEGSGLSPGERPRKARGAK